MSAASSLSTHVLDSVTGRPATGMKITLETSLALAADDGPVWVAVGGGTTDSDGRVRDWGESAAITPGTHRLTFATGPWAAAIGQDCFYPEVTIAFTVDEDGTHYHVPLLLSPYAYSTYRGS